jgi:hypothetical protein
MAAPKTCLSGFIVQKRAEISGFRERALKAITTQLRELLAARGYPSQALAGLRSDVTSMEDIEAGGGRFYFFR